MKLSKGGAAGLAGLIFLLGHASAPEAKIVKESTVKVVKVPKLMIVRDDERVVERVEKPFPKECAEALDYLTTVRSHDAALDKATQKMPELLSDAHRVFATGGGPDLVPITEAMTVARQEAANASIARAEALLRYDDLMIKCRPTLERKQP